MDPPNQTVAEGDSSSSSCSIAWLFVVIAVLFSLSLFDLGLWSQMLAEGCYPTEQTFEGCNWCSLWCSAAKTANTYSSSQNTKQPWANRGQNCSLSLWQPVLLSLNKTEVTKEMLLFSTLTVHSYSVCLRCNRTGIQATSIILKWLQWWHITVDYNTASLEIVHVVRTVVS